MEKNQFISVIYRNQEVGKIGMDEDKGTTSFQYHPDFLKEENYKNIFPYIFRKTPFVQVFNEYSGETFRGLPPMIADSLPDFFGNVVFNKWWQQTKGEKETLSVIEQLTYVSNRGVGAIEYRPIQDLPSFHSINLDEITNIAQQVLEVKQQTKEIKLDEDALFNIFKLGTSAGGARPKILVSENKKTGELIPGDIEYSKEFRHYIVKLDIEERYSRSKVEYVYYQLATACGIEMMPSFLIENKHFATERFDRQNGEKQHTLTVSGLTGWDFKSTENSSYENIFKLSLDLKVPHKDVQQLAKRMIFNIVFSNFDDHLKNFSFVFVDDTNSWELSPAYDITFPGDALITYKKINHACSLNGKRSDFTWDDILKITEEFNIKNAKGIYNEIRKVIPLFDEVSEKIGLPKSVQEGIRTKFIKLL